jgi:hypothetical protein
MIPATWKRKEGLMRTLLAGTAACALILSLAGRGEGSAFDNGARTSFRENAVESCVTASRNAPNSSQFDWPRLCGCSIDRYMAGRSTSELRNANPQDPALRAASQQCAMEQVNAAAGPAPATEEENGAKPSD